MKLIDVDHTHERRTRLLVGRMKHNARLCALALRLVWDASPKMLLALLALLVLQAALTPVQLALSSRAVDAVARQLGAGHVSDQASGGAGALSAWAWIGLLAAVLALGQLIQPFSQTFQSLVGDRLVGHVTGELIRATNRWQGMARFEDPAFADDLERASGHAARSGLELASYGARAILQLCTALGLCVILAGLHPAVPVVLVAVSLPMIARTYDFQMNVGSKIYVQTAEARRLTYCRDGMVSPEPAKDVRLYGLGRFFRRRYDDIFDRTVRDLIRTRWRMTGPMSLSAALAASAAGGVFVLTTWQITTGHGNLGDLVMYGGAAAALQATLQSLAFQIGFLPMVFAFLPSLARVLSAPADLPAPTNPVLAPRPIRDGIVFEDVRFSYPGTRTTVLDGVDLQLRAGESLALVGPNGSGKTTIVKLLLRLYDPTGGRILLDGRDLRDYDLDDLRREMGVLFQDFVRYEFTAADNIGFGRIERRDDRALLLSAAERAGAAALVASLPDGLDTQLGAQFGGRELSGGEWQKLALARAFARDSQLLVLDEPTAALDPRTEYDIFERFAALTRGRMTVLVSHRFSTVRMADRIVVLSGGRVIEEGSHEQLMAADGEYTRLYTVQASQYLTAHADDARDGARDDALAES